MEVLKVVLQIFLIAYFTLLFLMLSLNIFFHYHARKGTVEDTGIIGRTYKNVAFYTVYGALLVAVGWGIWE